MQIQLTDEQRLDLLQQIAQEYPGKTIENIINNIKHKIKYKKA